jgi:hypothetical protein
VHDLERARVRHDRNDRRRGKAAHQGAAAIGGAADDDRRAQDHPVEIAFHQRLVAHALGARELGRRLAVDADRGDLNHATHPGALACTEQRGGARGVHAVRGFSRAVLQQPGAVHDRADAGKVGPPIGLGHSSEVDRDHVGGNESQVGRPVNDRNDAVVARREPCAHGGADQPARANHHHAHAPIPCQRRLPRANTRSSQATNAAPAASVATLTHQPGAATLTTASAASTTLTMNTLAMISLTVKPPSVAR